jgi:RHS repeat-associated protein
LYTSYSEASDALSAYWPQLQAAQTKADAALRQAQDAHADLQRATTSATNAATDLKTAQQNQATNPNQQAVTDAQTAHHTAQTDLNNAKAKMAALTKQANDAYNDRINAAKTCASSLHHAQSDGIHNKSWWDHVAEDLSEWGGKIAEIANDLAPFLDVLALATSWIPGVDVITAALAEADNIIALVGTGMQVAGDAMQGKWGDALMGVGMLGAQYLGGKVLQKVGGKLIEKIGARGNKLACEGGDPVDVVSGAMIAYQTDLALPGTLPLIMHRAYSSDYMVGHLFGPGWSSTVDQRLSINAAGIHFTGDDAQLLSYPVPEAGQVALPSEGARWPLEWDRDNDEIRISDPWAGYTWHFADVHLRADEGEIRALSAMSDRNGNRIEYVRDERGVPVAIEHSGGYRVAVDTVATGGGARLTGLRLLDPAAQGGSVTITEYRYDDRGRLTGVLNSSGSTHSYEYDGDDRITAHTDRIGFRYTYEYDELSRVVRGAGDHGFLSATFAYDEETSTTVVTDSLGNPTTYRYDEDGHIAATTDPLGNTVVTEYDRYGNPRARIDALGARTGYEHDERGDVVRITAPDGVVTEFEYNELHLPVSVRTADGPVWRREYDERGNLTAVIEPSGAVTRAEYTAGGAVRRGADPLGSVVEFESDAAGLQIAVTDPLGGTTRAVRDAFGRVVEATDPAGLTSRFGWTVEGLMAWRVDPTGARTEWEYDAEGNLVRTVDPTGATTTTEVAPFGRIAAQTGPDGVRREFVHDTELNLRSVHAAAATWRYDYDAAGRLIGESDFIGRALGYEYDPAGQMIARTTGLGERIAFDRDETGRILRRRTPEDVYEYEYDTENRVVRIAGAGGTVEYTWDAAGRLAAETVDGRTMAYEYDLAGRRVRRITPSGAVSQWSFDTAGNPAALRTGSGTLAFGFDAAGNEVERSLGGARLASEFDPAGRIIAQRLWAGDARPAGGARPTDGARPVLDRGWTWRADGALSAIQDGPRGTRRFGTDAAGRVTTVSAQGWSESYAYDAQGNLTRSEVVGLGAGEADEFGPGAGTAGDSGTRVGGLPTTGSAGSAEPAVPGGAAGTHDTDRTLTRRARRTSYDFDSAGRVVRAVRRTLDGRRLVRAFSWDSEDRLVQTTSPDGRVWRFTYDPLGRRTSKIRLAVDGTTAEQLEFTWEGPLLAEQRRHAPDGSVKILTWDYDPGTVRPAVQRGVTHAGAADSGRAPVEESFHAVITDPVGSPTELVDDHGAVAWHLTTDLWGRTVVATGDDTVECPLRFPGQYHDEETGLRYNLHRYYDPESAAYLTPDPMGLAAGPNDHAYVPNPLVDMDPFGLMCDKALMKWADETESKASAYHKLNNDDYYVKNGTTAVVRARFPDGNGKWVVKDVVAHSGEKMMDTSVMSAAIKNGDIVVPHNLEGFTHAEYNALRYIDKVGGVPVAGGASRSVCKTVCGPLIRGTGGRISGQVYPLERGWKIRTFYWPGSMTY